MSMTSFKWGNVRKSRVSRGTENVCMYIFIYILPRNELTFSEKRDKKKI